jgi:hypothetical protein
MGGVDCNTWISLADFSAALRRLTATATVRAVTGACAQSGSKHATQCLVMEAAE